MELMFARAPAEQQLSHNPTRVPSVLRVITSSYLGFEWVRNLLPSHCWCSHIHLTSHMLREPPPWWSAIGKEVPTSHGALLSSLQRPGAGMFSAVVLLLAALLGTAQNLEQRFPHPTPARPSRGSPSMRISDGQFVNNQYATQHCHCRAVATTD